MPKKHKHAREVGSTTVDTEVDRALIHVGARLPKSFYFDELDRLQFELVRLQYWVKERGQRVVVLFEGRDAAGKVEHVMGFCSDAEYSEFLRACPEFERLLVRAGVHLIKYWLSVSDDEQERRFQQRAGNPAKLWKLSPMDLLSRDHWVEYSKRRT